jgi:hypothetical protein
MSERERFSGAAQHYLDGEAVEVAGAEERALADRLIAESRGFAARLPSMPRALDDAVMEAVRGRVPARRAGRLAWLVAPRTVRVRPVWIPALAAAAALLLWLAPRRASPPSAPVAAAPAEAAPLAEAGPDTVFVRFELAAPRAHSVSVAGSFNGWRVGALTMTRDAAGMWSVTVPLPVGEHRYDFVVDSTQWVPDPTAHAQVDDGFGGRNSVIVVGPKGLVRS